ncbi:MAG: ATP-binding protein [Nitrosomonas sp.]|nr:ATP-binding protein [Nitrosomonas sp.]MDP1951733.1 ATP-binding protein [Nitrosomonas sp.]
MNRSHLRFQVNSRLVTLLRQEYSSSDRALKELVDNARDADAERVLVTLPKPMSGDSLVIQDDGTGMTEEELRRHYLSIATDRRSRRGERTAGKNSTNRYQVQNQEFLFGQHAFFRVHTLFASWRRAF